MLEVLSSSALIVPIVAGAALAVTAFVAITLRKVVHTNEVHIVQSAKQTISYGKDHKAGNTYYAWPSWVPFIGVTVVVFPVSVFSLNLNEYEAYDQGRLPFVVDISAFFRIVDSTMAAQRISSFAELNNQLKNILQGAIRTILASSTIEEIMQGRSKFGEDFTKEVNGQLTEWGATTVKNIELMDIRDSRDSHVIQNIMAKKKSEIEMESRVAVADNMKTAQIAEIEAQQTTDVRKQDAMQAVGIKAAQASQQVGMAKETSAQAVQELAKVTAEKDMAVKKVVEIQTAEITKSVQIVEAEQKKDTTRIIAEGDLEATKRKAEGIALEGTAKAEAEKAMQLAPISAQITLAKEIGENQGYQQYLVSVKQVEATQAVGIEQAQALKVANIKVISNSGTVDGGIKNVLDMFSSKGGTQLGSMLEAVAQTDAGSALLSKFLPTLSTPSSAA